MKTDNEFEPSKFIDLIFYGTFEMLLSKHKHAWFIFGKSWILLPFLV